MQADTDREIQIERKTYIDRHMQREIERHIDRERLRQTGKQAVADSGTQIPRKDLYRQTNAETYIQREKD